MSSERGLQKHLSPVGAWAFSVGTSIGWGSLVVTASTYLNQAGPLGSVLGLAVGALVMLMIGWNYAYMMQCYPEAGGAYSFTREVFGYDQAFLAAWFLAMTYFVILWANATSLPLFGRIFLGGVFRVGKLYTLFGYDVYLGEALLSMGAMALTGLLLTRWKKAAGIIMAVLALLFSAGILTVFIGALAGGENAGGRLRMRMGVYASVDKTLDIERRFDYAKAAADSVKNSYLKSIGIYDTEMHQAELFKNRLVEDFRPSIEQDRFLVYYHPKFDIRPEKPLLSSAEALVRWEHPEYGLIGPAVFISILEENGLILELDQYVWRKVAQQIRAWKDRYGFSVPVSVNVSRIDTLPPRSESHFPGYSEVLPADGGRSGP